MYHIIVTRVLPRVSIFKLFVIELTIYLNRFCRFFRMRFMPTKTDRARLNQKFRTEEKAAFVAHIQQKLRQSKRSIRSGYAFSQQQGWGPLITSGRMQSKSATRNRQQQQPQSQSQNNNVSENHQSLEFPFHFAISLSKRKYFSSGILLVFFPTMIYPVSVLSS